MKTVDYALAEKVIRDKINIMRLTADEQKKIHKILIKMQKELSAKLMNGLSDYGKTQVKKLLNECTAVIKDYYGEMMTSIDYAGIAQLESKMAKKMFANVDVDISLPTAPVMKSLVSDMLIEGSPAAAWWEKQSADLAFRFASQIRQGVAQDETVQQIVQRVIGSSKNDIVGIMEVTRANAYALVHTSIQQISNDARLATFRENEDIVQGVQQLSTLDGRTTAICIAYSGQEWDLDGNPINGSTLPFNDGVPRHWNCRSVLIPITRSYKELGIDIPEKAKTTRASDLGQIKADTTFKQFLNMHDDKYADELLGKGRAEMYRDGKITLQDLVNGQGRELSLSELRRMYD